MSLHTLPCLFNTKQLLYRINSNNLTYFRYSCGQIIYKAQVRDVIHGYQEGGTSHTTAPLSGLKQSKLITEGKVLSIKTILKVYFSAMNTQR
jgi:hypothetical protein